MVLEAGAAVLGSAVLNLDADTSGFNTQLDEADSRFRSLGRGFVIAGGLIATAFALSFQTMLEFEAEFSNVRKTVDATEAEFALLAATLWHISTEVMPVAAAELAQIAAVGGQLGIAIENLQIFTIVAAEMGVATVLTSEQAATSMAKLANVTRLNVEQARDWGSVIVHLGNNFPILEDYIITASTRMGALLTSVGFGIRDILALSAALGSVGVPIELGTSAMQRLVIYIGGAFKLTNIELENLATDLGLKSDEVQRLIDLGKGIGVDYNSEEATTARATLEALFSSKINIEVGFDEIVAQIDAFKPELSEDAEKLAELLSIPVESAHALWRDAPGEFITLFAAGIRAKADEEDISIQDVVSDLGISNIRDIIAISGLAGAPDVLARAMEVANSALGAELADEVRKKFETMGAGVASFRNEVNLLQNILVSTLKPTIKDTLSTLDDLIAGIGTWSEDNPDIAQFVVTAGLIAGGLLLISGITLILLPGLLALTALIGGPLGLAVLGTTLLLIALAAAYITWSVEINALMREPLETLEAWYDTWWPSVSKNIENKFTSLGEIISGWLEPFRDQIDSVFGEGTTDSVQEKLRRFFDVAGIYITTFVDYAVSSFAALGTAMYDLIVLGATLSPAGIFASLLYGNNPITVIESAYKDFEESLQVISYRMEDLGNLGKVTQIRVERRDAERAKELANRQEIESKQAAVGPGALTTPNEIWLDHYFANAANSDVNQRQDIIDEQALDEQSIGVKFANTFAEVWAGFSDSIEGKNLEDLAELLPQAEGGNLATTDMALHELAVDGNTIFKTMDKTLSTSLDVNSLMANAQIEAKDLMAEMDTKMLTSNETLDSILANSREPRNIHIEIHGNFYGDEAGLADLIYEKELELSERGATSAETSYRGGVHIQEFDSGTRN